MNTIITVCLVIVGLINFVPVIGVLSASKLNQAYDINLLTPELIILMRHRALLFGIIGTYILVAAFTPRYQFSAMLMGLVSMMGFVVLFLLEGQSNPALKRIMMIDLVGLVFLGIAAFLKLSHYLETAK